jgi:hypothetical protein
MRRGGKKGHILVHVLITSVIIALISAGIARMLLTRYYVLNRATQGAQNIRTDSGGVNRVLSVWAKTGITCGDASTVGYTCTNTLAVAKPGGGPCTCCPADPSHDAALQVLASGKLCVLTSDGTGNGKSFTADTTGGGSCASFVCP